MAVQQTEAPAKGTLSVVRVALLSLGVGAGFAALSTLIEQPMPHAWLVFLRERAPILQIVGSLFAGLAIALPLNAAATTERLRTLSRRASALEGRPIPRARDLAE